jgi:hypothetical protein
MKKLLISLLILNSSIAFAQSDDSTSIDLNIANNSLANIFQNRYYSSSVPIPLTPDGSFVQYSELTTNEIYQGSLQLVVNQFLCHFRKGADGYITLNVPLATRYKVCPNDSYATLINRVLKKNLMK